MKSLMILIGTLLVAAGAKAESCAFMYRTYSDTGYGGSGNVWTNFIYVNTSPGIITEVSNRPPGITTTPFVTSYNIRPISSCY